MSKILKMKNPNQIVENLGNLRQSEAFSSQMAASPEFRGMGQEQFDQEANDG